MRVLVCGDRDWTDKSLIKRKLMALVELNGPLFVIDGACRGADSIGNEVAKEIKLKFKRFPADWTKYGPAAGPIRNGQMLKEGKPDLVLAFHDDLESSKGTKDMVRQAELAGVKVIKVKH